MNDVILVMLSYTIVLGLSFGILAFLQSGFLLPFLKVKTSRGKKILVRIRKTTSDDFVAGIEKEGTLEFKYKKDVKRISNFQSGLYRCFNLNCVDLDGATWGVATSDFRAVSSNDPQKTDSLITRALMRPSKKTTREVIIILLLVVIAVGLLFIGYKVNFIETLLGGLRTVGGTNI